jgi:hypothetical protein
MSLEPGTAAVILSSGTNVLVKEDACSAEGEARPELLAKAGFVEGALYRYPALLRRVFRALADPDGYDAGLRKLDDDLRQRGPSQFARFYIEELLGHSPESAAKARELVLFPSRRIREVLSSNEFMDQHDIILQREFAHLSREFFFHIPKSGGSTVFEAFNADPRFCPLHLYPGYDNGWFETNLGYLRNTVLRLADARTRHVFIFGHPRTSRILTNHLKRGWDSAFTIVRDPIDACLSRINYVLTLLCKSPNHPDVAGWRNTLGLPDQPFLPDRRHMLELASKIVELLVPDNPTCEALGTEPLLESVLDNAAILDLKIIRFQQIDDYVRYRGITRFERANISTRYVELSDLDRRLRLTMYDKSAEDLKFYDWVGRHMSPGDGPWFEL